VTFDDGYLDNLENAKPLLERYEIPATVFVASGYVGATEEFWWDELERLLLHPGSLPALLQLTIGGESREWDLGDAAFYSVQEWRRHRRWQVREDPPTLRQAVYLDVWRLLQPLRLSEQRDIVSTLRAWAGGTPTARGTHRTVSPSELRTLSEGGLIEIGAHTETHPLLSQLPLGDQRAEIESSKATLEQLLGTPVSSFAYPYGAFLPETISLVRDAGFAYACSTRESALPGDTGPFQVPRVQVEDWAGEKFSEQLRGWLG
jgi:peptidoglycan/xylan/chitin deacetylase (PgdA/CDA1 family)